jgi:peptidoglycan/xylan/chitin deacetylase (PgdA/CDA1 family)
MSIRLFLGCCLPAVLPVQFTVAADNSLPNPGFEQGDAMWAVSGAAQLAPEAAWSGRQGLRVGSLVYSAEGASVTSARLPVTSGQELVLAFQVRSQAACSGVYLWLYDTAGKQVTPPKECNTTCWVSEADNVWTARTLKVTVPAGVASVAVWVHGSPGVLGLADYDDFALDGIAPGATATAPPPPRRSRAPKPVDVASLPKRQKPALVVLKLDDVKQVRGTVHPVWQRVDEALASRQIKAAYGVICQTLTEATPEYAAWIRTRQAAGRVEFWFHGWDHGPHRVGDVLHNEFAGWDYEGMKALVDKSQQAALATLGFAFGTFGPTGSGAPGPSLDETALRVMRDDPHIGVVLYPMPMDEVGRRVTADSDLTILDRVWEVNLEGAVGVPDGQRLIAGYAAHPEREYFVLQGHPAMWAGERFNEFLRILDFLAGQKAVFVTPSECAAALRAAE